MRPSSSPLAPLARLAAFAAATAAVLGLVGCGGPARPIAGPPAPSTTAATAAQPAPAATEVARPKGAVEVFAEPGARSAVSALPATTAFGSARALLVTARRDGWLQVQLPTRPNGATGWIRADGVPVRSVPFEVRVDLSDRTLDVFEDGRPVVHTSAAVGTADAPTPTGRFYVVDKVETGSPTSAYGPFALGLSAHSEVLTEFGGGDGQVGIHGTSDASSIGRAASHGCVRVPNDVIADLAERLPLGTPVVVVG
jgi:lipoprotein-anchoring transpeptidase ErfK/SrfK